MMMANTANMPSWFNAVTGWDMDLDEMMQVGERISNMRMAYEVREGGNPRLRSVPTRVTGATTEGSVIMASAKPPVKHMPTAPTPLPPHSP